MAAILFNNAEPFEQIDNMPSTEGPMWNLEKISQAVSERKTFKDYEILTMYLAQGQGQITLGDKILIVSERVFYFDHTLWVSAISLKHILRNWIFNIFPIQMYRDANLTLP